METAVTTPSVPSAPINNCFKSYPIDIHTFIQVLRLPKKSSFCMEFSDILLLFMGSSRPPDMHAHTKPYNVCTHVFICNVLVMGTAVRQIEETIMHSKVLHEGISDT